MNLFYQPLLPQGANFLDEEESRHCVKVLRHRNGDTIRITDGAGSLYAAKITDDRPGRCQFSVLESTTPPSQPYSVHIAIAPTKHQDRLEWFVEKATEIGVDAITFIQTKHSEKIHLKKDRLIKVAVSAMKQSLRLRLPRISGVEPFPEVVARAGEMQRFIAHVDESNPLHLKDAVSREHTVLVLIGPEGDFSMGELAMAKEYGMSAISLGKNRLRTETAGLVACHIVNLVNA